jgi:hypothetical protein
VVSIAWRVEQDGSGVEEDVGAADLQRYVVEVLSAEARSLMKWIL